MAIRITHVRRSRDTHEDPHLAIECLGWVNDKAQKSGVSPRELIYRWIRDKGGVAFILDEHYDIAYVGARESAHGTEYVQSFANEVWTDALLGLPECASENLKVGALTSASIATPAYGARPAIAHD